MKKFINGEYVAVDSPAAHPLPANASGGAMLLMKQYPLIDFSKLKGTGPKGQITKTDVQKLVTAGKPA